MASGRIVNPQTWNRYTYVVKNPLVLVDPDGLDQESAAELARRLQEQRVNLIQLKVDYQIQGKGLIGTGKGTITYENGNVQKTIQLPAPKYQR
jgi:hypothetical protein